MPSAVTLRPLAVLPTKADLDDQVDVDLEAFQLSLDESVSAARSLVDSWIPTNLGPQWDIVISAGPSTLRPLRLGLGASASAVHAQTAADTKLRNQLVSQGKKRSLSQAQDNTATAAAERFQNRLVNGSSVGSKTSTVSSLIKGKGYTNGNLKGKAVETSPAEDDEEEEEEEEIESRYTSIKSSSATRATLTTMPFSTGSTSKKPKLTVQPLFSSTLHSQASLSTAQQPPLAAGIINGTLTKKQRKQTRRALLKATVQSPAVEPPLSSSSNMVTASRNVKPPFAPLDSDTALSSADEGTVRLVIPPKDEDDDQEEEAIEDKQEIPVEEEEEEEGEGLARTASELRRKRKQQKKRDNKRKKRAAVVQVPLPVLQLGRPT